MNSRSPLIKVVHWAESFRSKTSGNINCLTVACLIAHRLQFQLRTTSVCIPTKLQRRNSESSFPEPKHILTDGPRFLERMPFWPHLCSSTCSIEGERPMPPKPKPKPNGSSFATHSSICEMQQDRRRRFDVLRN